MASNRQNTRNTEWVHVLEDGASDPRTGYPFMIGMDIQIPSNLAQLLYAQGIVAPAVKHHLEQLMKYGLMGVAVDKSSGREMKKEADKLGLQVRHVRNPVSFVEETDNGGPDE